jgi:hypothetical protein
MLLKTTTYITCPIFLLASFPASKPVAKCAYRGERIREIEEKWIDENVKDEKEKRNILMRF